MVYGKYIYIYRFMVDISNKWTIDQRLGKMFSGIPLDRGADGKKPWDHEEIWKINEI